MRRIGSALAVLLFVFLPLSAQEKEKAPAPKEGELKSVTFGADDKENTKKLNELAVDGWEYVGPLGNGAVAFRHGGPKAAAVKTDKEDLEKKERALLQGTWKVLVYEEKGEEQAAENREYVFAQDKITFNVNGAVSAEGTFDLDATKSPRQLDYKLTSGQVDVTIYVVVGNYLIWCGNRDGKTRPGEFTSGTDKGGAYLMVLKRQK
jgi:uncharacterized protein (TIGR03067 family)